MIFWTKFTQKGHFHSKTKKVNSITGFCMFELLQVQISASTDNFDFLDQIYPKAIFPLKNKKREQYHWILHIRISPGTKISASTDNSDFLDEICPKRVFPIKNRKNGHHHWILHARIRVSTKFQHKVSILIFWTNFAQKGYFHSKIKKENSVIEFCIFELVSIPNFSIKWVFWFFGPNLSKKGISTQK